MLARKREQHFSFLCLPQTKIHTTSC